MRTITTEQTVYTFDELSESAKETARDWYRDGNLDYNWWEFLYNDFEAIGNIIGIEFEHKRIPLMSGSFRYDPAIYFRGFYSQGDGSSFSGSYRYAKGSKNAIREYAPEDTELHRITDYLQAIQSKHFYAISADISYRHDSAISVSVDYDPYNFQYLPEGIDQEVEELINDFNSWIFGRLRNEYEYLQSDEHIDESIRCNEYEFTENGRIA